ERPSCAPTSSASIVSVGPSPPGESRRRLRRSGSHAAPLSGRHVGASAGTRGARFHPATFAQITRALTVLADVFAFTASASYTSSPLLLLELPTSVPTKTFASCVAPPITFAAPPITFFPAGHIARAEPNELAGIAVVAVRMSRPLIPTGPAGP